MNNLEFFVPIVAFILIMFCLFWAGYLLGKHDMENELKEKRAKHQ